MMMTKTMELMGFKRKKSHLAKVTVWRLIILGIVRFISRRRRELGVSRTRSQGAIRRKIRMSKKWGSSFRRLVILMGLL